LLKKFAILLEETSSFFGGPILNQSESSNIDSDLTVINRVHFSDQEKIYSKIEESSSSENKMKDVLFEQTESKNPCHLKQQKDANPIIKVPVLLSTVNINIDIFDSLDLLNSISSISKIDWSIHSSEIRALLPSTFVFFKGILVANIEYITKKTGNSVHNITIQVPWKKATNIQWIHPPVIPSRRQNTFMFQSNDKEDSSYHHEYQEQFIDPIQHVLRSIYFVWNEELDSQIDASRLFLQGTATLRLDLLQEQYMKLNSLLDPQII
jgi:hypothetical protein